MSGASRDLGCNPSAVGLGHFSSLCEQPVGERESDPPLELDFPEGGRNLCANRGDNEV